jgi:GntR family transcriptional regulator, transcriptional repressor for pyruvate dehydrogenase complex
LPLRKAHRNSLVSDIVAQLEETIVGGTYKAGERLPSLRKLQELLGASHGTLREALRVLQQKSLIEVRLGVKGGAYVKESNTEPVTESLALLIRQREVSIEDLTEFRKVVESGLLQCVAQRAALDEIKEIKEFLPELRKQVDKGQKGWPSFLDIEVSIRKRLIHATRNRMYEAVLVPIHVNIFSYAYSLPFKKADISKAYNDWCKVIEAIEKRDGDKAASVMREHIDHYAHFMVKADQK